MGGPGGGKFCRCAMEREERISITDMTRRRDCGAGEVSHTYSLAKTPLKAAQAPLAAASASH